MEGVVQEEILLTPFRARWQ